MTVPITLAWLAAVAALGVLCGWRGARPLDIHKGPRLIPWRFLMVLAIVAALVLIVHLLNLIGVRTGR